MPISNKFFLILSALSISNNSYPRINPKSDYTIMLDPAGHAHQAGRTIGDSLERAVTYNLAKALENELQAHTNCTVIITRTPGEIVQPQQNANFANRVPINIYISLHCYHDPEKKHTISLYRMSRAESFVVTHPPLSLIPISKAHWNNQNSTLQYGNKIASHLQTHVNHKFVIEGLYALPIASLTGIQAPALCIELNCPKQTDSTLYSSAIAQSIIAALEDHE